MSNNATADPTRARRQAEAAALAGAASEWLAKLPEHVRPNDVAMRFPHIVNRLVSLWPSPVACRTYLEELLLDGRGDRQGFPERVALELAALKNHYESVVFPTHQTVWDEIINRVRS